MYKFDNIEKSQITKHLNLKNGNWKVVGLSFKGQEKWTSFSIFAPVIIFKTCSVLQKIASDLMFWFNHWKQNPPKWILAKCTKSNLRFRHLLNLNGSEIEKHKATSREDRRWKTSSEQQFTSNYSHLKLFLKKSNFSTWCEILKIHLLWKYIFSITAVKYW